MRLQGCRGCGQVARARVGRVITAAAAAGSSALVADAAVLQTVSDITVWKLDYIKRRKLWS